MQDTKKRSPTYKYQSKPAVYLWWPNSSYPGRHGICLAVRKSGSRITILVESKTGTRGWVDAQETLTANDAEAWVAQNSGCMPIRQP